MMEMRSFTGSDMYDLCGSLAVFGFLTAYALVCIALPFARRAMAQNSHVLTAVSIFTVLVILMIAVFDLRSTADATHARIPWIYLGYIGAGIAWYALRRKRTTGVPE
jgi:amino acid transporter